MVFFTKKNYFVCVEFVTTVNQSDYNGFGVSCFGASDGYIILDVSGTL